MPEIPPLAAIAAAMRKNLESPAPVAPTGDYYCSRCGAALLQNKTTSHWESEDDLDICPEKPTSKGGFGIWHSPRAKPKQEEE